MLRRTVLLVVMAAVASILANATQITVGSYNIRTLTGADTGPHYWDNRREYVARTVTDNGFDVVGFNEVITNRQYQELIDLLPGYSFYSRYGNENPGEEPESTANLIGFRADKFELLDQGWYFLSRDITKWETCWDNSVCSRHTAWVKLQVKGTDEIFYFFCTHLDHQGNIARMLQSHINYEQAWKIAGSYPTLIVGDQNSNTTRVNYMNLYKAGFTDAFSVVVDPEAKFGKADPATSGQWNDDPTAGRRIDFIWARGFTVDDYDHCTNNYDLGARPSDHIAIMAKVTYVDPDVMHRCHYVSPDGGGAGTAASPYSSLQTAVDAARIGDTIYIAAGEYEIKKQLNITKSVHLFGGYDATFANVTGLSALKAVGEVRCVMLRADTDVEMRNIGVYNGNVPTENQDGGGICAHGARLIMRNCEVADNSVSRDGGAIDCTGQLILDHVRFMRNKAGRYGGAVCYDNPNKRYWFNMPVTHCLFEGNEAVNGAAMYLPRFVYGYVAYSTFASNKATAGTPVYIHAIGTDNNLGVNLAVFNNTFALNSSSGEGQPSAMYVEIEPAAPFALANNTVVSNTSGSGVPAVYMPQGTPYVSNNIIACNEGGDVYLNANGISASYNLYTSDASVNYPVNAHDIYSTDAASAATALAGVLDGEVVDGRFMPRIAVASDEEPADVPVLAIPSIAVVKQEYADGKSLSCISALRLRENVLRADFNFDCMQDKNVSLIDDQAGVARPTNGKATMGAREYVEQAGIEAVWSDSSSADSDAPVEYFNLQGQQVQNPAGGIFIRRQGHAVSKVVIR